MKLRTILLALALLVVLSASVGGYLYYSKIRESIFKEAERQSLLEAEHIRNQISIILFENLKVVKALGGLPEFRSAIRNPNKNTLKEVNQILDHFNQALKLDLCTLMNSKGLIIASSDYNNPNTLIGRNYAFRPYFKKAMQGEPAVQMVLGATAQHRDLYYANPVLIGKKVVAAIVIKTSIYSLENYFQQTNLNIWALRDKGGVVLASNKENWLYHIVKPITPQAPVERDSEIITSESPKDWIRLDELENNKAVDSAGHQYYMHRLVVDPMLGWEIIYLTPMDIILNKVSNPMLRNSGEIVLALCLVIVLSVILLFREAHTDLLKRKKAEEEIKHLKEFNENIVQSMSEGITIQDKQGNLIFINPAAAHLLGYQSQELFGKHWTTVVPPDQQKIIEAADQRRLKRESDRYEVQLVRKDGRLIHVLISGKPIFEKDAFAGTLAVFTDITERKKAEEEIRKLSSAIEQSIDGIAISDLEARIFYVNEAFAKMHGYTPEEMNGLHFKDLQQDTLSEEYQNTFRQIMSSGAWTGETESVRKGNESFATYISYNLLKNDHGQPQGILAIVRDISNQKKLETQLQQIQKIEAIGTLAGGIAHNFNNLLMGIQGNASLMLLEMEKEHPHFKMLKSIEDLVQTGAKLTGQLLGYAREGRYEVKPLNLNRIVKETAETFSMTKKEIRVYLALDKELRGTMADQGQIEQVLLNLYVNAADAMPMGGELFLETKNITDQEMLGKGYTVKPGPYVMILVRDTGIGMDENIIERIFDPFFTTKGLGRGTGLGLASVYGIVKSHGGYIDVQSQKGKGTTFRICLPANAEKIGEEKKTVFKMIKGTETILLVDDEEQILDVSKMMLKQLGYQVLTAKSGHEAMDCLIANIKKIDLVVLDMIMPDMSGHETFDRLKEKKPELKVLLSSGYSIDGLATEILQHGCDGFIPKPFDLLALSGKIREILDKK